MQEYGLNIPTKGANVQCVTMTLEDTIAEWMVTVHNNDVPDLGNCDHFMTALWKRFEDRLADCKIRMRIKTISQGC